MKSVLRIAPNVVAIYAMSVLINTEIVVVILIRTFAGDADESSILALGNRAGTATLSYARSVGTSGGIVDTLKPMSRTTNKPRIANFMVAS